MSRLLTAFGAAAAICAAGMASAATNAPNAAAARAPANTAQHFASEDAARAHCPSDTIVWVNTRSHVYHFAGNPQFGHTKHGTFMCQGEAASQPSLHVASGERPSSGPAKASPPVSGSGAPPNH